MIIELITFRLAPGADEDAFIEADRRVQTEFIPNHEGFLRRTTARAEDGEWLVVVLWYSAETAEASKALWDGDPVMQDFLELVDRGSLEIRRYEDLGG